MNILMKIKYYKVKWVIQGSSGTQAIKWDTGGQVGHMWILLPNVV